MIRHSKIKGRRAIRTLRYNVSLCFPARPHASRSVAIFFSFNRLLKVVLNCAKVKFESEFFLVDSCLCDNSLVKCTVFAQISCAFFQVQGQNTRLINNRAKIQYLQGRVAFNECSASCLNCKYLKPYIKLKLTGLAIEVYN